MLVNAAILLEDKTATSLVSIAAICLVVSALTVNELRPAICAVVKAAT